MSRSLRRERIDLRANPEVKAIIERAAQLHHTTLSAYLLSAALQQAKADLQETETLLLNEEDRSLFYQALAKPPQPNEALRALLQEKGE